MKRFLAIFTSLVIAVCAVCADEATLFDSSVKADVLETGYDWVSNAEVVGVSGIYQPGRNLYNPIVSEKYGLCVRADNVPTDKPSRYAIKFVDATFNEPNVGAGIIKNVGSIKSMDITLWWPVLAAGVAGIDFTIVFMFRAFQPFRFSDSAT